MKSHYLFHKGNFHYVGVGLQGVSDVCHGVYRQAEWDRAGKEEEDGEEAEESLPQTVQETTQNSIYNFFLWYNPLYCIQTAWDKGSI